MAASDYIQIQVLTTNLLLKADNFALIPKTDPPFKTELANKPDVDFYLKRYTEVGAPYGWTGRILSSKTELHAILNSEKIYIFWIVSADGEFAGMAEFFIHSPKLLHLNYFGLTQAFQGKGVGVYALQLSIAHILSLHTADIFLHTCEFDHPAAVHVYKKAGFEQGAEYIDHAYYPKDFLNEYLKNKSRDWHIERVRKFMRHQHLQAMLFLSSDPHNSEYLPEFWSVRKWLSGFTGSAGTLLITEDFAGLWTDSRYFIQAETELAGSSIQLMKLNIPHTPEFLQWMCTNLQEGSNIGLDGRVLMHAQYNAWEKILSTKDIHMITHFLLPETFWLNRPDEPENEVFVHKEIFTGKSTIAKLDEVSKWLKNYQTDGLLVCALDEIAYLLNLRGNDIAYNPVFMAFVLVTTQKIILFVNAQKLNTDSQKLLIDSNVEIKPYPELISYISQYARNMNLSSDFGKLNQYIYASTPEIAWKNVTSPVGMSKALKNQTEIRNYHHAMLKDGAALTQFAIWLEQNWNTQLNEHQAATVLREFRSKQTMFVSESFQTISSFGGNAAIVHYAPDAQNSAHFEDHGVYLLDSGAQYLDGTTDITRMFFRGNVEKEICSNYTLVLKGHIQLASAVFPRGTYGYQLDVLARLALWKYGKDYGHGTGHGVGFFLNVHEGPQAIRQQAAETNVALMPGMVLSIEPGYYLTGKYGLRIENLYVVQQSQIHEIFLCFEPLTLAYIETEYLDKNLLLPQEIEWLNTYQSKVYEALAPLLSESENKWLANKTASI